jgi:hypothetical protein
MTDVACEMRDRSGCTDPKKKVRFRLIGPPTVADMSWRLNGSYLVVNNVRARSCSLVKK